MSPRTRWKKSQKLDIFLLPFQVFHHETLHAGRIQVEFNYMQEHTIENYLAQIWALLRTKGAKHPQEIFKFLYAYQNRFAT